MQSKITALFAITVFNALTAIVGGLGLITGIISPPASWIADTVFGSYIMPGIILALVVGGSALIATVLLVKHVSSGKDAAGLAGLVMMGWITGEVIILQHFSWLQVFYFVIGYIATALAAPDREARSGKSHGRATRSGL